jgi:hypothetical protein
LSAQSRCVVKRLRSARIGPGRDGLLTGAGPFLYRWLFGVSHRLRVLEQSRRKIVLGGGAELDHRQRSLHHPRRRARRGRCGAIVLAARSDKRGSIRSQLTRSADHRFLRLACFSVTCLVWVTFQRSSKDRILSFQGGPRAGASAGFPECGRRPLTQRRAERSEPR